jgi:hypothetical protein
MAEERPRDRSLLGQFAGPLLSASLGVGVSVVAFFIGFIGEHRINRERLDNLTADVAALRLADRESAADRRLLSERLSHIETSRIAPARGRE